MNGTFEEVMTIRFTDDDFNPADKTFKVMSMAGL
jgi:hypothetical protein